MTGEPPRTGVSIAFRHVTGRGFWSRLVHVVAGPPVHCVLLLHGTAHGFHAVAGAGVEAVELTVEQLAREGWEVVPVRGVDALTVHRFCAARVGARYDYLGAVLYGTALTTRDRWTCSELCAEAVVAGGAPLHLLDAGRTPRRLRRALRGLL